MHRIRRTLRVGAPVLALAVAGLAVVGCDDEDSKDPSTVAIEATGAEGSLSFEAPDEADAGAAEIELTNSTELEEIDAQLVFVPEGQDHSDEEVVAELGKAFRGMPVADWFQGGGGPGPTAGGETQTVTQELQAGTYYVVGGEDLPKPPLTKFTVSGDDGAELPDADATVSAVEYSFAGEGLEAGEQSLLLENDGGTWHHFLADELKPDATIEQAKEFLMSEGEGGGPSPFASGDNAESAVSSTVLEGGTSQLVDVNLEPGRYAFYCFISDKTGGPPHVVKGMVSEVTVSE
jgi:hypothetical protein